ncbi:flippase [Patescibacteria group bacterium]|nr:flippase [Patescibacteria group bacterium]
MNLSQKVAFNIAVQIGSKAITAIFGLLVTVFLTNYLGPAGFGSYMYVISLVIIFGSFSDWGTAAIGAREASKNGNNQSEILSNVITLRFFSSLLIAGLMFGFSFLLPLKTDNEIVVRQMIRIGSILLLLLTTKGSLTVVFQTKLKLQLQSIVDLVISLSILIFTCLLVRANLGLFELFSAVVVANFLGLLVGGVFVFRTISFKPVLKGKFIKSFLSESFPMGAILLMFTIDNKIDTVMLGAIKGDRAVGIYAAAYRVYDVLILGAAYFMIALFPVLSRFSDLSKYKEKVKAIYEKSFNIMLFLAGVVFLGILIFAPLMVKVITQSRFSEFFDSILIMRFLSVAIFFSYLNHITGYTIVALGKQRQYFFIAAASVVFNVLINLFVIPRFSYNGAAMVTILTEFLVFIATTTFVFKTFGFSPSIKRLPKALVELVKSRGKIF